MASKGTRGYVADGEDPPRPWIPNNPMLPSIPIKKSYAYGSQGAPGARKRQAIKARPGTTDLKEITLSVNEAIKNSELVALASGKSKEHHKKSHRRRQPTEYGRRRTKREPTPDETQLHQALREVTASPTRDYASQNSDSIPSPPIPRTVSTDSSPAYEPPLQRRLSVMSNSPLYPSPLQRGGHEAYDINSPGRFSRQSSVDDASVVSWNLERDIHEDDLKRTRPSTHGSNITAPPRRPSGLANIIPDTIQEEEEEDEDDLDDEEEDEEEDDEVDEVPLTEPAERYGSELEAELTGKPISDPEARSWTTSVRTIIPSMFRSEPSPEPLEYMETASPNGHLVHEWPSLIRPEGRAQVNPPLKSNRANWVRVGIVLLLSLALAFAFQTGVFENILIPRFSSSDDYYSPNTTDAATVHRLRHQISKMNEDMSSLSRELVAVRSKQSRESNPTYAVDQPIRYEKPAHKINFLSPALGALVDPYQTTPTIGRTYPFYQRAVLSILGLRSAIPSPSPPVTALRSWEEMGDCWCTAPRNGVSQISILLGRDIVPQEVVVEHVPASATLDPGLAPREIEMWARYRVIPLPSHVSSRSWFSRLTGWGGSEPKRPIEPVSSRVEGLGGYHIPGEKSLHDVVMSTLQATNLYDPDSTFSDDPLLGPNFYRIGKMTYDIHKENYIQRFDVNTIIDIPTIRVDKVAFRFKSNWGSNSTCIYRLKLHGHL